MGAQLERIIAEGTRAGFRPDESTESYRARRGAKPSNKITCADGFHLSVIAGSGMYCSPWPGMDVPDEYEGPFTAVEVGYPSKRPEPWSDWEQFCDGAEDPTGTVYGFVPVETVRALVERHGGEA